jgi:hypothetical protein
MRNAVFTIDVAGEPRSVFSVQERASGDLTLLVNSRTLGLAVEGSYERICGTEPSSTPILASQE